MRYQKFKQYVTSNDFSGGVLNVPLEELVEYQDENNIRKVRDTRSYIDNGFWHVRPVARNEKQMFIVCPVCGDIHIHGIGSGHRVPDCRPPKDQKLHDGYVVDGIE